ncbi:MAG: metallophosphoesterase [Ruminococcus sp.]
MKKFLITLTCIVAVLLILLGINIWYSANVLTVNTYNIKTDKLNNKVKFVLISDLHNKEFGENNIDLVNLIREQSPEFIAVDGDMVTDAEDTREAVIKLLPQLCDIAPVYYVLGNHEKSYAQYEQLIAEIKESKATFLDNEMVSFKTKNGETITIGGLSGYPYYDYQAPDYDNPERYFLDSFIEQEKDNYSILLSHQPETYFWGLKDKNIDLMLCGHTHGGLIRLPFVGGLTAPNQKFLPEYDMGYFNSGTVEMIITSGLGNSVSIPRIGNPPEVCVIEIN